MKNRLLFILSNWDFNEAFAVYDAHFPDGFTKDFLRGNKSAFARMKLEDAIKKLIAETKETPKETHVLPVVGGQKPQPLPVLEPLPIQKINATWKPIYQQLATNKMALLGAKSDADRYALALGILNGWDEVYDHWAAIDYYREHGKLPAKKVGEPLSKTADMNTIDRASLAKRVNTLRTYISKAKDKPAKAEAVEAWKKEITEIEQILANP